MKRLLLVVLLLLTANFATAVDGVIYKATPFTLVDGQDVRFQADANGNLKVNVVAGGGGGGGSGSNAAAGTTGIAVPTSAGYTGFNSGGNLVGVSSAAPLPVSLIGAGTLPVSQVSEPNPIDNVASGSITTQNSVPAGTATAGSAVEIAMNGGYTLGVQVTGTYGVSTLSVQITLDGVNWVTLSNLAIMQPAGLVFSSSIPAAQVGVYSVNVGSVYKARVTATGAITGTAVVSLRTVRGSAVTAVSNIGTVTSVSSATVSNGQTVHSSPSTGNPMRIGGRVVTTQDLTLVDGDASDIAATTNRALVTKSFSVPELDWTFASPSGGIATSTSVVMAAAAGSGLKNYLTGLTIQDASATVATEVVVLDGSTVIWRGSFAVGANLQMTFPTPLRSSANSALSVQAVTTGSAIYVNAQGYIAP